MADQFNIKQKKTTKKYQKPHTTGRPNGHC